MNVYLLMRLLHILSAVLLLGGVIARQLARSYAGRATEPAAIDLAFKVADPIEKFMVIPGSMLVILFGILLALVTGAPLFGFLQGARQNWLLAAEILMLVTIALVPMVFLRRGRIFGQALAEALARGEITSELRASLNDPVVRAAHWFEIAAILAVIYLMVFKPF